MAYNPYASKQALPRPQTDSSGVFVKSSPSTSTTTQPSSSSSSTSTSTVTPQVVQEFNVSPTGTQTLVNTKVYQGNTLVAQLSPQQYSNQIIGGQQVQFQTNQTGQVTGFSTTAPQPKETATITTQPAQVLPSTTSQSQILANTFVISNLPSTSNEIRYYQGGTMNLTPALTNYNVQLVNYQKVGGSISMPPQGGQTQVNSNIGFFETIGKTFKSAIDFGVIGTEGIGSYYEKVKQPTIEFFKSDENIYGKPIQWSGTINTLNPPSEYKDLSKLSPAQFSVQKDITNYGLGMNPQYIGVYTQKALSDTASSIVQKNIQTQIDLGNIPYTGTEEQKASLTKLAEQQYGLEFGKIQGIKSQTSNIIETSESTKLLPGKLVIFGAETLALNLLSETEVYKGFSDIFTGKLVRGAATQESLAYQEFRQNAITGLESKPGTLTGFEVNKADIGSEFKLSYARDLDRYGLAKQTIDVNLATFRGKVPVSIIKDTGLPQTGLSLELSTEEVMKSYNSFFFKGGKSTTTLVNPFNLAEKEVLISEFSGLGRATRFGESFTLAAPNIKFNEIFGSGEGVKTLGGTGLINVKGTQGFKEFRLTGIVKETPETYNIVGGIPYSVDAETFTKYRSTINSYGTIKKLVEQAQPSITFTGISQPAETDIYTQALKNIALQEENRNIALVPSYIQQAANKLLPKVESSTFEISKASMAISSSFNLASSSALQEQTKTSVYSFQAPKFQEQQKDVYGTTFVDLQPPKVSTTQETIPTFRTPTANKTEQVTQNFNPFVTPSFTGGSTYIPPVQTPFVVPPFLLPSFDFSEYEPKRRYYSTKFKTRYQPSFTALAFGIKGTPKSFRVGGEKYYGGLRPIIGKSKKQKSSLTFGKLKFGRFSF